MFAKFARLISRHWVWVLVAWIILPIGVKLIAPKWDTITHDGDFAYLPDRLTSVRGAKLADEAFPDLAGKSSVVLVVSRNDGELSDEDKAMALRLANDFAPKPENPLVAAVLTHDDKFIGSKLTSADGHAVLVVLQLKSELMAIENMPFINRIYKQVRELKQRPGFPAGLEIGVTGSAPVGSDMLWSTKESIDNTELATIALVIFILLIVYRAPALVLVPLVSIAVSYFVAIDVIALVAKWCEVHQVDFQVYTTTNIFIVVILFGAATDYCLFLIARYREELEHGLEPRLALEEALGQTGHALTASAMTTILGLGAMVFADFGKYRSGGPTIAMSLVVALAACMTVAPALLRAMGRTLLWELQLRWIMLGLALLCGNCCWYAWKGRPHDVHAFAAFAIPNLTVIFAFALIWVSSRAVYALVKPARKAGPASGANLDRAPTAVPSFMGRFWTMLSGQIVAHPGFILVSSFLVLAIPAWHGFNVPITYDMLAELNPSRESVQGMQLLEKHFLVGETGPITILANRRGGNFEKDQLANIELLASELAHFEYVDSKGEKKTPIHSVSCLTNPLGEPLTKKKIGFWTKNHLSGRELVTRTSLLSKSRPFYLSSGELAGEVTRFELVCDYDPFSQESMRLLGSIDTWLAEKKKTPNSEWQDVEFDFTGITAQIRDLDAVNRSDTFWVGVYVALAVMIVLLFLIRRPLVSVYLIFTVVFGYLVSLGLTHLTFSWLYGNTYQGLDWKLKLFLFVILVAVGEDYNIYLVTRVFEEQRRRGPLKGLREAVIRTGGIITSCGVIMAGTFGSMATGTLRSMIELGFAMSLGVLLDTFIIRTVLVPAFLALLARRGAQSTVETRGDMAAPHYESVESVESRLVRSSK